MAYASWSVTSLEQPTLAKWNILGTNDAYFNTQVGADFSSGTTSTVWWEELGRTTLGSTGDTLASPTFATRKYLQIRFSIVPSGQVSPLLRFNADSGANYAQSYSSNFAAAVTGGSATGCNVMLSSTTAARTHGVIDLVNVASLVKVGRISSADNQGTSSAADVPIAWDSAIKWVNTANAITTVTLNNGGTGDYLAGSELIILGHD